MLYNINKKLHNDFSVFELNKLPPRAYAIPYKSSALLKSVGFGDERYSSDMTLVLSGEWDFKFYKSINDLPDKADTIKIRFDKITVPGDWQRHGFEEPVYLNCPYQFRTAPPYVPEDLAAGVYRKTFELDSVAETEIITFLGVANNLSLYVNGTFAGYSEGTHNTAEFDITNLLQPGKNEIFCVLFKWCNGSFLEAQDMFRENGIFRDVYLAHYEGSYIYDFEYETEKLEGGYSLNLSADIRGEARTEARLITKNGRVIAKKELENGNADFGVMNVREWSAELPEYYILLLTVFDGKKEVMSVRQTIGFRTIEIKNGIFTFNGKPIKCKGVNHHDTDLYKGYAMSLADMERDVSLMKELNVNAVRTSHYPPDPYFITLADINGLYIIDEADIETHGMFEHGDINGLSHDLKWATHYVDRVKRMYYRDRNHPAVIMWSLGNESGGYKCHDRCYAFLKSTGTKIPVHYEGANGLKRFHYDVISEMYTSTENIEKMIAKKRTREINGKEKICHEYEKYPFYLCEYCHAMGVGPGNMEEYWDLIYEWDNSMGGCVWEWADHTVYHPDGDKKYKYRYTYGGDHGEKRHDGHFCADGLMYADRRLHTGAKEMKVVYRPVRASVAGEKIYCFENTNRFRDSSYIDTEWSLTINGIEKDKGSIKLDLEPMQAECIEIKHADIDPEKDAHLNLTYKDKEDGHIIAAEQLTLNSVPYEYDIEIGSSISAVSEYGRLKVVFENGFALFDGKTGALVSYTYCGKDLLNVNGTTPAGFNANLYRALIDNDSRMRDRWAKAGLNSLKSTLKSFDAHIDDGEIDVETVCVLRSGRKALYETKLTYVISSLGAMEIKAALRTVSDSSFTDIPRFGLTVELDRSFDSVRYYGRGDSENMPDFKCQAPVGIYSAMVDDMFEPYVYPQESGMHCETKWIDLISDDGIKLSVYADTELAFSVHHFTQDAINRAQHQEDLKDMNTTFLTLDGFDRGIGSSSCGPDTRDEYKLDAGKGLEFGFTLIPSKA